MSAQREPECRAAGPGNFFDCDLKRGHVGPHRHEWWGQYGYAVWGKGVHPSDGRLPDTWPRVAGGVR